MSRPTPPEIHRAAADGYAVTADTYVRGRPDYPPALATWLRERIGLDAQATVVDLGAGTGKFTPRLLATGARVIAVEPVVPMRAKLMAALPSVAAVAGTAESIPLADAAVDAVVCAQSFHWFATTAALREIHRVLKPGGRLGLIWNVRDATVPWVAQLDRIVNRVEGDTPRYYSGAWRGVFPSAGFGDLHATRFAHGHTGTVADVIIGRVLSTSFIAALPAGERAKIMADVDALIAATPALTRALQRDEAVTLPYTTDAYYIIKTTP